MKIKLSKKQAEVVLACLEEINASPYWTNEETWNDFVCKTEKGVEEIDEIILLLTRTYGLDTGSECYDRIFVDCEVRPVNK